MRNMATSLLRHETIRTTVPKAKELRRVVEPLITMAKIDSLAKRRLAFSRLRDDAVVEKLFTDLGPRFKTRAGGYTRILKMEPRPGDSADMALMQLVDLAAVVDKDEDTAKGSKAPKKFAFFYNPPCFHGAKLLFSDTTSANDPRENSIRFPGILQ